MLKLFWLSLPYRVDIFPQLRTLFFSTSIIKSYLNHYILTIYSIPFFKMKQKPTVLGHSFSSKTGFLLHHKRLKMGWKRFLRRTGHNKFSWWTKFKVTLFSTALHSIQKHSNSASSLALFYPTIWPTKHNHINLIIQSTLNHLCKPLSASSYKLIFFVFIEMNELVHQVVTHLTCNWELPSSNISQDTSYPSWDFL